MSLDHCCGRDLCSCQTHDRFMCHVRDWLYPPFARNTLCVGGYFDQLTASVLRPLWELHSGVCGDCHLAAELDPIRTCCFNDLFFKIYNLPDECFEAETCWIAEPERVAALKAQLVARVRMEWQPSFTRGLLDAIAEPLGIEYAIKSPTPTHRMATTAACEIVLPWKLPSGADEDDEDCGERIGTHLGSSRGTSPFQRMICIEITGAPCTVYATVCSPMGQPLRWNPYIDAFKCIVEQVKPCNLSVRWEDHDCDPPNTTTPPRYEDCPDERGVYRRYPVVGSGTAADPYTIDFSELSVDDARIIAAKLAGTIP